MKNKFNIPVITGLEYNYNMNTIDHFKYNYTTYYSRVNTNYSFVGIKLVKSKVLK